MTLTNEGAHATATFKTNADGTFAFPFLDSGVLPGARVGAPVQDPATHGRRGRQPTGSLFDFYRNGMLNARNFFLAPTSRKPVSPQLRTGLRNARARLAILCHPDTAPARGIPHRPVETMSYRFRGGRWNSSGNSAAADPRGSRDVDTPPRSRCSGMLIPPVCSSTSNSRVRMSAATFR